MFRRICAALGFILAIRTTGVIGSFAQLALASNQKPAAAELGPIIFVPGFGGSKLIDSRGRVQWLTRAQIAGLRTPDLSLRDPADDGDGPGYVGDTLADRAEGRNAEGALYPQGLLGELSLIPGLLRADVYKSWVQRINNLGREFIPFTYDWRQDPVEISDRLDQFLGDWEREHPGRKIDIVGHSLGGLLVRSVMSKHPKLFRRVIFVGAPFRGDIALLRALQNGVRIGLNKKIMRPEVFSTFPAAYVFFPEDGESSRIKDHQGNEVPISYYRSDEWFKHSLGIARASRIEKKTQGSSSRGMLTDAAKQSFLNRALTRALEFRGSLKVENTAFADSGFPEIDVIVGTNRPTHVWALQATQDGEPWLDFNSPPRESGDGEVWEKDAIPQGDLPFRVFISKEVHNGLMRDRQVIRLLTQ